MRETARRRYVLTALIFSCALVGVQCSIEGKWPTTAESATPRVVQIQGVEKVCKYPPAWCIAARENRPVGVLARDGDLFSAGKDHQLFLYRDSDGESLVLETRGEVLLLNGKAISIRLSDKDTSAKWLRTASIGELPTLRLLVISVLWTRNARDLSVVEQLPRLAWVGFPENTTQKEFDRIVANQPDLEVVEIRSEAIGDLSLLLSLRHLKALLIVQKSVDLDVLRQLKGVRYLAVSKDWFKSEAAETIKALEQALPDTFVAPFCLGSGWIPCVHHHAVLTAFACQQWSLT